MDGVSADMELIASRIPILGRLTLSLYIRILFVWTILSTSAVCAIVTASGHPVVRAVLGMAMGLVWLWIVAGGLLMRRYRDRIRAAFARIKQPWQIKFVAFCTLLILMEELITTGMTNLAPLFGVPIGKAYITASSNYFDVISFHSVVVIAPMFLGWAWLLSRYDFSPNAVFLLFGLTGTLCEVSFGGAQQFASFGMWTFVYGLMVYLPAYCIPRDRAIRTPRWLHYPIAVFFPILFAIPVAVAMTLLFHHPKIDFPPLTPNG